MDEQRVQVTGKEHEKRAGPIQELITASGTYSIAVIAQRLASILLLPVYTRVLNPSDYAITELLDLTLSLVSMLIGGQFAGALFYYYANSSTQEERDRTVSTVLLGTFLLGGLSGTLGFIAAPLLSKLIFQTDQEAYFFRIASVSMGLTFSLEACFNWLRAINKPRLFVGASILRLGLATVLAVVLMLGFKMKITGVLWSTFGSVAITTAVLSAYCWVQVPFRFDVHLFWKLFRFSAPIGLVSISMFVIHFGDRFLLQRFSGLATLGLYSLAYKISMSVGILQQAFGSYWSAQVYHLLGRPDGRRIFARTFTYLVFAMSTAGIVIIVTAPAALRIIAAPAYYPAVAMIPWLVGIYVVRAATDHIRSILYVEKKPGTDATVSVFSAAVCIAGYLILIPRYASYGAIAATGLAFVTMLIASYRRAQHYWPFFLERTRVAKLAAAVIATIALSGFLSREPAGLPMHLAEAAGCLAFYGALITLLGFVTSEERNRVMGIYRESVKRA
jgi:O-antigen/teichoic acid export membrane protein